jgi:hypothetical protein
MDLLFRFFYLLPKFLVQANLTELALSGSVILPVPLPEFLQLQVMAFSASGLVLFHPDLVAAGFFRFVRLVFLVSFPATLTHSGSSGH